MFHLVVGGGVLDVPFSGGFRYTWIQEEDERCFGIESYFCASSCVLEVSGGKQ